MWKNNQILTAKSDTIQSDCWILEREVPNGNAHVGQLVVWLQLKVTFNGLKGELYLSFSFLPVVFSVRNNFKSVNQLKLKLYSLDFLKSKLYSLNQEVC